MIGFFPSIIEMWLYRDLVVGLALVVGLDISQVTSVPVFVVRQTVLVTFGVIVTSGAHAVRRRAIAILMDVESVLLPGVSPSMSATTFTESPSWLKRSRPWHCCPAVGCKTATALMTGVVSAARRVITEQRTDAASIACVFI
jgi:hypothetical protein